MMTTSKRAKIAAPALDKPEKAKPKPLAPAGSRRAGTAAPSGRNPSERIDLYIAGIAGWRGNALAAIRRVMREADPAVTEDWKWMGSPVWYCDGMIAVANAHREKVKVTFAQGAHLADPGGVFNAGLGGKEWRAIDVVEKDQLDEAALRRLVKTAIAYNRAQRKDKERNKSGGKTKPRGGKNA